MKYFLSLFLLFTFTANISGQSYRYWMSQEVEAYSPVVKNQRIKFYKKRVNDRSYIKMVNSSCFDARYSLKIGYAASRSGKPRYFIEKSGIIEKGQTLYFNKNVPGTRYISLHDYDYSDTDEVFGIPQRVTYFYPAQDDKVWTNDIVVLKCLGFDSNADYESTKRATIKRQADVAMERFNEEMRLKKIEDERKVRAYLEKGLSYHANRYESKKKDGFFYNVPMDSLEMIANHYGKYMIIVHTGPGYRPGMFNLSEESEEFLDNQVITGLSHARDRSFIKWVQKKSIDIKYTPAVIIMNPDGQILHQESLNTTQLKDGFANWVRGISQSLETSGDNQ